MCVKAYYELNLTESGRKNTMNRLFAALKSAQRRYEKCDEVDARSVHHFVTTTLSSAPNLAIDEEALLKASLSYINIDQIATLNDDGYARIRGSLVAHPTLALFTKSDSAGNFWGKGRARMDCSAATALGWLWDFTSYNRLLDFAQENGDLPRTEVVVEDSRSKITRAARRFPQGFGNRIFENWWVWERIQDVNGDFLYVLAFAPADEYYGEVPSGATKLGASSETTTASTAPFVKGSSRGIYIVRPIALNLCEVVLVQTINFGGSLPSFHAKIRVASSLLTLKTLQTFYRRNDRDVDRVSSNGSMFLSRCSFSESLPQTIRN